jgi:hypothetical protein
MDEQTDEYRNYESSTTGGDERLREGADATGETHESGKEAGGFTGDEPVEETRHETQTEQEQQEQSQPAAVRQAEQSFIDIVKKDGMALKDIDRTFQTPAICSQAVKQNFNALQFVPEALHTHDMYTDAVKQDSTAMLYIPEKKLTPDLCLTAIKHDWVALEFTPEKLHTHDMYTAAVTQNWRALSLIDPEKQTETICSAAVEQNGAALEYVDKKLKTQDMCKTAVAKNGEALQYVPEKFLSDELCAQAVKQRGDTIRYLPKEKQSPDLSREAVLQNGYNIQHIIEPTPDLCMTAVANKGDALKYIPRGDLRSPQVCLRAVQDAPDAVYHLFPENTPASHTLDTFEKNFKTVIAENRGFNAQDTLQILNAALDKPEQDKLIPFLADRFKNSGKTIPDILSQWEREARGIPEPVIEQATPAPAHGSALEQFLSQLHTEAFYQHPDQELKKQFYTAHLDAVQKAGGPLPPVFNLTSAKNKEQVEVGGKPSDAVLNPFSQEDIQKMKAAAKVGVVFADESKKEEQLAFIKKNIPEVHAIIMQTLDRQHKEQQQLVIGDTKEIKRTRTAPSYDGYSR